MLFMFMFFTAISQEKQEVEFRRSIETFAKDNLRHSFTDEKVLLPDATTISHEKTLQTIEGFDRSSLKHAQTAESEGSLCKCPPQTTQRMSIHKKTRKKTVVCSVQPHGSFNVPCCISDEIGIIIIKM